eukprot:6510087-Pyramimonas_sp.AAC.1
MEGRARINSSCDAEGCVRIRVFAQPPRMRRGDVAYLRGPLNLDDHSAATMNAEKCAHFSAGLTELDLGRARHSTGG